MKAVAVVLGLAAVAGLAVLAAAGFHAALGILLTALAIVAMIALGSLLGGRAGRDGPPRSVPGPPEAER